jgi:hypothetical protein
MAPFVVEQGLISCIPPQPVINADGTVKSDVLNTFVNNTLLMKAVPPSPLTPVSGINMAESFANKANKLRQSMNDEYCWYYNRYIWALTKVLTDAAQSGAVVNQTLKDNTIALNTKLNTILLVMKVCVNSRLDQLKGYYNSGINDQNHNLDTARERLAKQSKRLQDNDLKADVQSAMIDYSIEKNSSSRNLLAVYGFMNMVAVGLLFYLYTHTKE